MTLLCALKSLRRIFLNIEEIQNQIINHYFQKTTPQNTQHKRKKLTLHSIHIVWVYHFR